MDTILGCLEPLAEAFPKPSSPPLPGRRRARGLGRLLRPKAEAGYKNWVAVKESILSCHKMDMVNNLVSGLW